MSRGEIAGFKSEPTDNMGNSPYPILGSVENYSRWPTIGTALYALTGAVGGQGHKVTIVDTTMVETTLFVVEVKNAGRIQDFKFTEVTAGGALTTASVETTGPATLVSICWGDAGGSPTTFGAGDGFEIIEEQPLSQVSIEGAVAYRNVATAGTYSVTWTATQEDMSEPMGALLYLVALEP